MTSSCSTSGVSACGSSGPRLDPSHDFTLGESSPSRDGQGRPSASRGLTTAPRVEPVKEHPANVGTTSIEMTAARRRWDRSTARHPGTPCEKAWSGTSAARFRPWQRRTWTVGARGDRGSHSKPTPLLDDAGSPVHQPTPRNPRPPSTPRDAVGSIERPWRRPDGHRAPRRSLARARTPRRKRDNGWRRGAFAHGVRIRSDDATHSMKLEIG